MTSTPSLSASLLEQFRPLDKLAEDQRVLLASKAVVKSFRKKTVVLELNASDSDTYFLLEGKVLLEAIDGRHTELNTESPASKNALANLKPRKYRVTAKTDCHFIVIADITLEQLLSEAPGGRLSMSDIP